MKPTGGGATVTPIAPPVSLFPGITGGFNNDKNLGANGANTLEGILKGTNLSSLFSSIQKANDFQTTQDIGALKESFGASGMGMSSDMMGAITNYQTNNQKQLTAQFGQLGLQNEAMQLSGLQDLMGLATSFAPTQVVGQAPSGNSMFSQISSAAEAAAMIFLMAGCWIAESLYGKGIKTNLLRAWLHQLSPKWFRNFYLKHGEWISTTPLRFLFYPLFEFILWRNTCLNIAV